MRALNSGRWIVSGLILACPGFALGAPPSLKVASSYKSEKGSTGASTNGIVEAGSLSNSSDISSGSALGALTLRMGYDRQEPAYDRILITDRQGNTEPLSRIHPGPESSVRGGLDLAFPATSLSLDYSRTLGASAYPGQSFGVKSSFDQYSTGTRYLLEAARSDFSGPRAYFVDPDTFRTHERPSRLLENQLKAGVEQVLAERLRLRLMGNFANRPDRRPSKAGAETSLSWAFHDNKSLVATLGTARELRASQLFDERGYLDATWLQTELRWEPSYSWSFYGRLGTMLETETARGRLARQRVGTDMVGLEARRAGGKVEFGLNSFAAFSNTGYRNLQLGGNLTWLL